MDTRNTANEISSLEENHTSIADETTPATTEEDPPAVENDKTPGNRRPRTTSSNENHVSLIYPKVGNYIYIRLKGDDENNSTIIV